MSVSPHTVRADVATALHLSPEELSDDQDLLDAGLDSVRIIGLVERWREAGSRVGFIDLADRPTLRSWTALLAPAAPDA